MTKKSSTTQNTDEPSPGLLRLTTRSPEGLLEPVWVNRDHVVLFEKHPDEGGGTLLTLSSERDEGARIVVKALEAPAHVAHQWERGST